MLKDIPFFRKGHEESYKSIDEVSEIADYFNFPDVTRDLVML